MTIGVLALQGAFGAHLDALRELGLPGREVRTAADIPGLEGLVLPGGESTAMLRLMDAALRSALFALVAAGAPVLGTCAGLILMARAVTPAQACFGWLDVDVRRNGWGRQRHSAVRRSDGGRELVLIRAPRITRVGRGVEVLDTVDGEPVLVRQGEIVGATFHSELTGDRSLHRHLLGGRDAERLDLPARDRAAGSDGAERAAASELA